MAAVTPVTPSRAHVSANVTHATATASNSSSSSSNDIIDNGILQQFNMAVSYIQDRTISKADFPVLPSYEQQLAIYAWFKQATCGDNNDAQPWVVQASKRIKWEAWNKLRGMTKQSAMTAYVNELLAMSNKFDVNVLTSRGREVVAKFYNDMGVLPPPNIAAALASVSPSSSSSSSASIASTPVRNTPLPSLPSSNNRATDNDIGSPATPRAAHHPLVKEVRGQQDDADKKLAELENQVLRLLAAKASAPVDGGATPRIFHQQNELRQILDQLELRERAREERVKRMEESYQHKLRQLEAITPLRPSSINNNNGNNGVIPMASLSSSPLPASAITAAAAAAAAASVSSQSSLSSSSSGRGSTSSPFPLPRELQIGMIVALGAYTAYSFYQRYKRI